MATQILVKLVGSLLNLTYLLEKKSGESNEIICTGRTRRFDDYFTLITLFNEVLKQIVLKAWWNLLEVTKASLYYDKKFGQSTGKTDTGRKKRFDDYFTPFPHISWDHNVIHPWILMKRIGIPLKLASLMEESVENRIKGTKRCLIILPQFPTFQNILM